VLINCKLANRYLQAVLGFVAAAFLYRDRLRPSSVGILSLPPLP
jgi:hypothetical protein